MSPKIKYRLGQLLTAVTVCITVFSIWFNYMAVKTHRDTASTVFGVTFSKQFAQYLGLDWKRVYASILDDLRVRYIRIPAYWEDVEPQNGIFNFADTDWQIAQAAARKAKVVLVLGRRQPRWPECHDPAWVKSLAADQTQPELEEFIRAMVQRYKENTALEVWQVENEPFLSIFGDCPKISHKQLETEVALVRALDPKKYVLVTDSGELSTWRRTIHAGDLFGTTVYRRSYTPGLGYLQYWWMAPSTYRVKAAAWGRPTETVWNMEMQAEPWFKGDPLTTPLSEQEKTMTPTILADTIAYARRTELPRTYLWGVEWWYWMKEKFNDPSYLNLVKQLFTQ